MSSHPLYESPEEDQGRESRTSDWNETEIASFLEEKDDSRLKSKGSKEELMTRANELGIFYDEDRDWREEQLKDSGDRNYDWNITCRLVPKEDFDAERSDPDDYVPDEVRFLDENEEVQIEYVEK